MCNLPVYSPRISLDMMTVKMGAELFTVSAKETATFFRLTKPRTTVMNLSGGIEDRIDRIADHANNAINRHYVCRQR